MRNSRKDWGKFVVLIAGWGVEERGVRGVGGEKEKFYKALTVIGFRDTLSKLYC